MLKGVDTNILVRAYLEDDLKQAIQAQQFLQQATKTQALFISSYTILEFVWVLKVKKFSRTAIHESIITLIDSPGIIIGERDIILSAIEKYLKGKADFGDYMIVAQGEKNGAHHLCTFDKALLNESKYSFLP